MTSGKLATRLHHKLNERGNSMKTSVSEYDFKNAFMEIRPDNFSSKGLTVLFDHLEELENDIGEEMELDVIAICCDYYESTLEDLKTDYPDHFADADTLEDAIEILQDVTMVAGQTDTTVIYVAF